MKNPLLKILAKKILMFIFIFSAIESFGQTYYPYAVTDKFRRVGRYHVENGTVNSIADTITDQEAKSIIAINAVGATNAKTELNNIQVRDFVLLIEAGKKSKTIKSVSDQLTPEMRMELQHVSSGTRLTFKEISLITYDGTTDVPKQMLVFVVN